MTRRHPPSLVNPSDVVRTATDRQLGLVPPRSADQRIDQAERLLARHDNDIVSTVRDARSALAIVANQAADDAGPGGPPVFAAQTGAGTTGSTSGSAGNDEVGRIELIPGGAGIASGDQVVITFSIPRPNTDYVVLLTPANAAARTAGWNVAPTNRSVNSWTLTSDIALTSGSTYAWFYYVRRYERRGG